MSTILIIDDDASVRDMLARTLGDAHYELVFAASGREGLQKASETLPDLVLLDVLLPDLDGFEVCRHMRLDPLLAELPVVIVTGLADRDARLRGIEAGADDVITKPFDHGELRALVRTITKLDRYRKRLHERDAHQRDRVRSDLALETTLEVWARALEMRGAEAPGHIRRVLPATLRLARELGLAEGELARLRLGVLLHDIGLMGVPDETLLQTRPLADGERARLHMHPVYAHNLLASSVALQASLDVPYCHHEHWDGTGYPRGLSEEAIPLAARIFAVVDAWDELAADRPRGQAWPRARVREHIREQAGRQFDPHVVEAFDRIQEGEEASVPAPAAEATSGRTARPRERHAWRKGWSLVSQGSRVHFVAAGALISILPVLALAYFAFSGLLPAELRTAVFMTCGGVVLAMMALGYGLLAKYPQSIVRLRGQLDALAKGVLPLRINLARDEDDLVAIEKSMRDIVVQSAERIRTIEQQTEALLVAERQRVAIEGLGAACHHLGQPTTSMRMALHLVRRAQTAEEREARLAQCEESAEAIADTLVKLQHIASYRTQPYLAATGAKPPKVPKILEI